MVFYFIQMVKASKQAVTATIIAMSETTTNKNKIFKPFKAKEQKDNLVCSLFGVEDSRHKEIVLEGKKLIQLHMKEHGTVSTVEILNIFSSLARNKNEKHIALFSAGIEHQMQKEMMNDSLSGLFDLLMGNPLGTRGR